MTNKLHKKSSNPLKLQCLIVQVLIFFPTNKQNYHYTISFFLINKQNHHYTTVPVNRSL